MPLLDPRFLLREVEHQIRIGDGVVAARESAALEMVRRAGALAQEEPLRADEWTLPFRQRGLEGYGLGAGVLDVDLQVVLQVFPHGGNIDDSVDAEFLKFVRGTDAGQLQQLRGVECTSAADDGAAVFATIAVLHSDCAYSLEQDPVYRRARSDCEVLPA